MKSTQKLLVLRESELLESLNPIELSRFVSLLEELELPKHNVIFSPGELCDSIYLIERGRVRVTKVSTEGRSVILALAGPGDILGEAMWDVMEHDSFAETLSDSCIYQVSKEQLCDYIRENPEFGLRLISIIGCKLRSAQSRIEDLVFRQVPSRVARLLLALSDSHGKVTLSGIRVEFPLTHQEIADLVGSSRVTVTQIINKFKKRRWITIESKRVTIHDVEALDELVKHSHPVDLGDAS